jgi:3-carboxy-cis,cis-muconate cycloisomerase
MTNLLWPGDHRAGELMIDRALLESMVAVESAWLQALVAAEDSGNPVTGLVALLRERAEPPVRRWIHRGLTSQDVLDTALMLTVRDVVEQLEGQPAEQVAALAGETLAATTELATLLGVRDSPAQVSLQLVYTTAGALGLAVRMPWRTTRAPVTAAGHAFVGCTDAWSRIGSDVVTLAGPEIAELSEPATTDRSRSSSMPQTRNPLLSILIRRAVIAAPALAATLHTAVALAHDERPDGAWHAEWDTLRTLARRAVVAGSQCSELLAGLTVHPERMAANLDGADVLAEQRAIAGVAEITPSSTYLGAVDALIDASLNRARSILKEHR